MPTRKTAKKKTAAKSAKRAPAKAPPAKRKPATGSGVLAAHSLEEGEAVGRAYAAPASRRWQAAKWPGRTSVQAGSSTLQRSKA
jgi:hypothetical protein